jgi:uncharacterized protein YbjT (DUF2867 family)
LYSWNKILQSIKMIAAGTMASATENPTRAVIAMLGGSGRFGGPFIRGLLDQGLTVRVLTRSPRKVARCFARARTMRGNMTRFSDVVRIFQGAAAALLITPMGGNDDPRIELQAARTAVRAAAAVRLPHLIHLSLVQPPRPTGVPLLDVKGRIETEIRSAGIPFSCLRTGCYMDIWLSFLPIFMKLGFYLLPIAPDHRFSFTSQRDVVRVAAMLIHGNRTLNGPLDVIDPRARTLREVIDLYAAVTGRKLRPLGRWLLPLLKILKPTLFRWIYPSGASRVSLFSYFSNNDWVGDPRSLPKLLPEFRATPMEEHLQLSSPPLRSPV